MKKEFQSFIVLILLIFTIFSIVDYILKVAPNVKGNTIYVGGGGPDNHSKIQDGINAAIDGDTVYVYNGTYYENVVVNKCINLVGEDKDNTLIDGSRNDDVVRIEVNWVNVTGFTISNSSIGSFSSGIKLDNVQNCSIVDNNITASNYYAMLLLSSNQNYISTNNASGIYQGLGILVSNDNHIEYNNISNTSYGIILRQSFWNNVTHNIITLTTESAILIWDSSENNNIVNNTILENSKGIVISQSNSNIIDHNNISENNNGITLFRSISNNITANIMRNNGIFIEGHLLEYWNTHFIDASNTVNGKPTYYWKNQTGGIIPVGAGQVILANCSNITIENQELCNSDVGIELGFSFYNDIIENNVSRNNRHGVALYYSSNNLISDNNASFNYGTGIFIAYSDHNEINNNNVTNNSNGILIEYSNNVNIVTNNAFSNVIGICIDHSPDNIIFKNNASRNQEGIYLLPSSDRNTITRNYIYSNTYYGIHLWSSSHNYIFHNIIIDNVNQAYDDHTNNYWNSSYPLGGNYWSNYAGEDKMKGPNQDIPGIDGIGDWEYVISGPAFTRDYYPLMEFYKPLKNYTILHQGWNLISIPTIQEEQNLTRVLGSINSWYDAVQFYDPIHQSDYWKHNKIGKPFGNDLYELNESLGFWIYITNPGDTIFLYNGTQPTENQTIYLQKGWNTVGYPSLTHYNRSDGLNNLTFGNEVDAIWAYNSSTQKWIEMSQSDYFELGRGYYILAKTKCEWEVPL